MPELVGVSTRCVAVVPSTDSEVVGTAMHLTMYS